MRRKFAWIPVKRHLTPLHQNGFLWLEWYWEVGGKAYKDKPEKIRIRMNSKGECVYITMPDWCFHPPFRQYFKRIKTQYSGGDQFKGIGAEWPFNL